jgi:spore maturation protein CgeB
MRHRLVFLGLTLSSSWGNGHATTYRGLLAALAARGNDILFLERDCSWYAAHRDLWEPAFCELRFYRDLSELAAWCDRIERADAVIVGSYVPEGAQVCRLVQQCARGVTAFYDIDTPVTLASLDSGEEHYLSRDCIAGFDLYLSFTGGPTLQRLQRDYGARTTHPLYCAVDPVVYHPTNAALRWNLGYIGTYSHDRQSSLESLLFGAADALPDRSFVVVGPQYPPDVPWPSNVEHIEHLAPSEHAEFYSSLGWTLNLTRAEMKCAGYSPSVRLFEAAACGVPIMSDYWPGLESIFHIGSEIMVVENTEQIVQALTLPRRDDLAAAARRRVFSEHTADRRAQEFEAWIKAARRCLPDSRAA